MQGTYSSHSDYKVKPIGLMPKSKGHGVKMPYARYFKIDDEKDRYGSRFRVSRILYNPKENVYEASKESVVIGGFGDSISTANAVRAVSLSIPYIFPSMDMYFVGLYLGKIEADLAPGNLIVRYTFKDPYEIMYIDELNSVKYDAIMFHRFRALNSMQKLYVEEGMERAFSYIYNMVKGLIDTNRSLEAILDGLDTHKKSILNLMVSSGFVPFVELILPNNSLFSYSESPTLKMHFISRDRPFVIK